jgi:conjugative relaxase-like TrwC/TraI family protein
VLRVAKVGPGGHAYYLDVAAGGRGSGIEAPGRWLGSGAAVLGLHGVVTDDALGAVLRGDDPFTHERLGRWHDRVTVAAFDLTFCAPKSVSLLHALAPDDVATAVEASHGRAVEAALDYVERRAAAVRRRHDAMPFPESASAVASAGFVHRVSRALDPHLHSHVVMANLGRGPEGTFSALDGRGIYAHAPAAGALYHAQLRHELTTRLGVDFEPLRGGRADVAGIGVDVRRAFSQRAAAIAEHLDARGLGGTRAKEIAGHATRPPRQVDGSIDELRPWWEERAQAAGLNPEHLGAVLDRVPRVPGHEPDPGRGPAVAVELAGRGATATRRDVIRAWCATMPRGAQAPAVERAADEVLLTWAPVAGHAGRVERCGVGERRHVLPGPEIERTAVDGRTLEQLLAWRGMSRTMRAPVLAHALGRDDGLGIG